MSEKLDEFILATQVHIEQLEGRIEAQQLVIGWLLSRLDQTDHFQPDAIPRFLSGQASELDGNPKYEQTVASIDELRSLFSYLASARQNPG